MVNESFVANASNEQLVYFQELDPVLQHPIAQTGVAGIELLRVLANLRLGVGGHAGLGQIVPGIGQKRVDARLGHLEVILKSEQAVLESEHLVLARSRRGDEHASRRRRWG